MTLKRKIYSKALQLSVSNDVIHKAKLVFYHLHIEFHMSVKMLYGMLIFKLLISSITDVCKKKYFQEFYTKITNKLQIKTS